MYRTSSHILFAAIAVLTLVACLALLWRNRALRQEDAPLGSAGTGSQPPQQDGAG